MRILELMPPKPASVDDSKFIKGAPTFSDEQFKLLKESRKWNVALGHGLCDWADIKNAAEAQPGGCDAYISEREYFGPHGNEEDPFVWAKRDYDFLRSL